MMGTTRCHTMKVTPMIDGHHTRVPCAKPRSRPHTVGRTRSVVREPGGALRPLQKKRQHGFRRLVRGEREWQEAHPPHKEWVREWGRGSTGGGVASTFHEGLAGSRPLDPGLGARRVRGVTCPYLARRHPARRMCDMSSAGGSPHEACMRACFDHIPLYSHTLFACQERVAHLGSLPGVSAHPELETSAI